MLLLPPKWNPASYNFMERCVVYSKGNGCHILTRQLTATFCFFTIYGWLEEQTVDIYISYLFPTFHKYHFEVAISSLSVISKKQFLGFYFQGYVDQNTQNLESFSLKSSPPSYMASCVIAYYWNTYKCFDACIATEYTSYYIYYSFTI